MKSAEMNRPSRNTFSVFLNFVDLLPPFLCLTPFLQRADTVIHLGEGGNFLLWFPLLRLVPSSIRPPYHCQTEVLKIPPHLQSPVLKCV